MKWATIFWILLTVQLLPAQKLVSYLSAARAPEALPSYVYPDFSEIPFDLVNGMIVVKATINEENTYFILDTGAPMLVINNQYANNQTTPSNDGGQLASSCSGALTVGTTNIQHFTWGTLEKKNLEALTVDLSHLEKAIGKSLRGLIGFEILKDREIFIDYARQRILLLDAQKNVLHRAATPLQTSTFEMHDHLPTLQLNIGGKRYDFGLDTGSESNLIDGCTTSSIDPRLSDTIKMEEIQGLDQKVKTVPVIQLSETQIGQIHLQAQPYLVTELCHLKSSLGTQVDGLLGYDFFSQLKISINYPKKQIYFWGLQESM